MRVFVAVAVLSVALASPAFADVIGLDETDNPNGGANTLTSMGFTMTAVDLSSIANGTTVSSVSSGAGTISFDNSVRKVEVGAGGFPVGWASWSGGRMPHLLTTNDLSDPSTIVLTLPGGITAFDFYVEPNQFETYSISATVGSTVVTQDVLGAGGAKYYGFYATGGDTISSITISAATGAMGFAWGEMRFSTTTGGSPVPEPATFALLGLGLAGVGARRHRRRRSAA